MSLTELQITPLLQRWQEGDQGALEELLPLVYHQLSLMARNQLRRERADHTFSTSDLVHEAFIRLFGKQDQMWTGRKHFFGAAGQVMRHILINHAAARNTQKRGVDFERAIVALHELGDRSPEVLGNLDTAINQLYERDRDAALVVELRYFCGFTIEETAREMGLSPATVKRRIDLAKVWLDRYLT